jgi:hypothetical protein
MAVTRAMSVPGGACSASVTAITARCQECSAEFSRRPGPASMVCRSTPFSRPVSPTNRIC